MRFRFAPPPLGTVCDRRCLFLSMSAEPPASTGVSAFSQVAWPPRLVPSSVTRCHVRTPGALSGRCQTIAQLAFAALGPDSSLDSGSLATGKPTRARGGSRRGNAFASRRPSDDRPGLPLDRRGPGCRAFSVVLDQVVSHGRSRNGLTRRLLAGNSSATQRGFGDLDVFPRQHRLESDHSLEIGRRQASRGR